MKILLAAKANLEELFADPGTVHLTGVGELQTSTDRILPGFRALMNLTSLPDQVVRSSSNGTEVTKSN